MMWICSNDVGGGSSNKELVNKQPNKPLYGRLLIIRKDILTELISAGCCHLTVKILSYLDSESLLAASLVCRGWQRILLSTMYSDPKFRKSIRNRYHKVNPKRVTETRFTLDLTRTSIIDVTLDDDLNVFILAASVISGRAHVLCWPFFSKGQRHRWMHRFTEYFHPGSLTCLSAGHKLVALGGVNGKIHIYESSVEFKCLRLIVILAHHRKTIHSIIFYEELSIIVSCSDDMTVGVIKICPNGSLLMSKIFHGHVSRVRAIDVQGDKLISGSDDRSVKLWNLNHNDLLMDDLSNVAKPLRTMNGHGGPVTGVKLSSTDNLALSSAGVTVRLWEVDSGICLKLFQHDNSSINSMVWISTFRSIATVDASGSVRIFSLEKEEEDDQDDQTEILRSASSYSLWPRNSYEDGGTSSSGSSPNIPTYRRKSSISSNLTNLNTDPGIRLESIPHHLTAFSIHNKSSLPYLTVYCLDFVP